MPLLLHYSLIREHLDWKHWLQMMMTNRLYTHIVLVPSINPLSGQHALLRVSHTIFFETYWYTLFITWCKHNVYAPGALRTVCIEKSNFGSSLGPSGFGHYFACLRAHITVSLHELHGVPNHWLRISIPLWGESTCDWWIPLPNGPVVQKACLAYHDVIMMGDRLTYAVKTSWCARYPCSEHQEAVTT